jgi:hypothetical protein
MHHNPQLLSAGSINGDHVRNAQGESVGHIKELMIDLGSDINPYW